MDSPTSAPLITLSTIEATLRSLPPFSRTVTNVIATKVASTPNIPIRIITLYGIFQTLFESIPPLLKLLARRTPAIQRLPLTALASLLTTIKSDSEDIKTFMSAYTAILSESPAVKSMILRFMAYDDALNAAISLAQYTTNPTPTTTHITSLRARCRLLTDHVRNPAYGANLETRTSAYRTACTLYSFSAAIEAVYSPAPPAPVRIKRVNPNLVDMENIQEGDDACYRVLKETLWKWNKEARWVDYGMFLVDNAGRERRVGGRERLCEVEREVVGKGLEAEFWVRRVWPGEREVRGEGWMNRWGL